MYVLITCKFKAYQMNSNQETGFNVCSYMYYLKVTKKIGSKTTKKRWKHHFPHYKTMGVFLDTQVQITPYYVVLSGRNSNSSYILCMSSIPTNLKWIGLIQSEKKWKYQFFRRLRTAYSVVRGRIWPNFKLIHALMYVIITCKYEKDPIKNNREKVARPFFKL